MHKPDQPLPIDSQPPAETKPDQAALEAEAELRAKKQEKLKAVLDLQKQKEALIQKQIEEQKKIMDMLEKNKNMDSKVREELMNSLKSINKNLQPLIKTTEEALAKSINPSGQSSKEPADTSGNEELQATVAKLKAEVWFYSQDNSKLILPFRLKHWASQTQLQPRNQRLQWDIPDSAAEDEDEECIAVQVRGEHSSSTCDPRRFSFQAYQRKLLTRLNHILR